MKEIIKPWEEEIYGYENHYHRPRESNGHIPLEKIISLLRNFEDNLEVPRVKLVKYKSEENPHQHAYDIGFPIYRGMTNGRDGGHTRIMSSIIGKHPLNIYEIHEGDLKNSKIPEEYKIDFRSMSIRADNDLAKEIGQKYNFPKEIINPKKIPTPGEISNLIMEGEKENRRINSEELISLYK